MRRTWTIADFDIEKKIGDGQYSKVYLAKEKNVLKTVALKVISNKTLAVKLSEEQFRKEIKIQHKLKHENILKLFGFFDDDKASYIVLEFCEYGEMYKDIRNCKGYTNERAATYIYQMSDALDYCFNRGVIHRDIKTENILISAKGAAKLADFGWSTNFINCNRQTFCGTLDYMSPEMINGKRQDEKIDLWCLGVLLFEMLTTFTPFHSLDKIEFYENIKMAKFKVPNTIHMFAKYLIINILRLNIFERLTAKQIMTHPFVERFAEKTLVECKAALEQWSTLKDASQKVQDTWTIDVACPVVDFDKEPPNDIDIYAPGNGSINDSYSLMKEKEKEEIKRSED